MFRFKLRNLLVATALVGVYLALQIHVHKKAKRFLDSKRSNPTFQETGLSASDGEQREFRLVRATVFPLSFQDVFLFKRRCEVSVARTVPISGADGDGQVTMQDWYSVRVSLGSIEFEKKRSVTVTELSRN